MSTPPEYSEEELRALEAEMDRISVDDVLLQTVVSLVNLGARKAGVAGGGGTPDLEQTRQAIEGARALLPLLETRHADKLGPIRDALSQLQMLYVQRGDAGQESGQTANQGEGDPPAGTAQAPEGGGQPETPEGPGPAQRSGKLWIPGQ
jgi:hypothetical protein